MVEHREKHADLLSTEEAALYLRVSKATLETWRSRPPASRSRLAFVRVGKLVRYRYASLEAWLKANEVGDCASAGRE